ncbi:hypothetical protein GO986_20525 [Deinococcus sp. HMF7620]|uniref:Uncharacterized protein n=1 Tax=Deinococcus arboris TaxID=2682977 RepID=A0A7C9I1S4_9DEIO|nr:hypothetical protein [Deinococcus arboris]MVN89128.1 hypothetical protein [Deinococcus arboris]
MPTAEEQALDDQIYYFDQVSRNKGFTPSGDASHILTPEVVMRPLLLTQRDIELIFNPEKGCPELRECREETFARVNERERLTGPLTTERLLAGIPFPLPPRREHPAALEAASTSHDSVS